VAWHLQEIKIACLMPIAMFSATVFWGDRIGFGAILAQLNQ
jgi:hypothetical protein